MATFRGPGVKFAGTTPLFVTLGVFFNNFNDHARHIYLGNPPPRGGSEVYMLKKTRAKKIERTERLFSIKFEKRTENSCQILRESMSSTMGSFSLVPVNLGFKM